MKCIYEIVKTGNYPTFQEDVRHKFTNPISVGDKVKTEATGSELRLVESIEHYPPVSVLYVK